MLIVLNNACFEGVNQDEVEEGHTGIPNAILRNHAMSMASRALLVELIARLGNFDLDRAKEAEMTRRRRGGEPEDIDELLAELADHGYIELPKKQPNMPTAGGS